MHWLNPKFIFITKNTRLTSKQLTRIIIRDSMTEQEKKILTEILHNRKTIPAQDFMKIGKVKRKVAPPQKI